MVGDLLLGLLGKVRMIPQVLQVLGKITVAVRNIGSIEKVFATRLQGDIKVNYFLYNPTINPLWSIRRTNDGSTMRLGSVCFACG